MFAMITSTLAIIGYIILITNENPVERPGVSYVGTFFAAAGIYPSTALALSWPANNVSGQTKRAVAAAMQIMIGNIGGAAGVLIYRPAFSANHFRRPHIIAMGYVLSSICITSALWFWIV